MHIATDKEEVDYWKSEVIMCVVEYCFQSSSIVNFKVNVKERGRLLSISSIFYIKLHKRVETNRQVAEQNSYPLE